jgi:uncharacterized protein (UPF0276 family)/uncharacterized low-complexity protein
MTNKTLKPVAAVVGVAFISSMAVSGSVLADENPFDMTDLDAGYKLAGGDKDKGEEGKCGDDKGEEGKCGEGKCGDDKGEEGKCGEGKCGDEKGEEGKCGEGKCGEEKGEEGKCGEGKCGEEKGEEGKCGEGKCGEEKSMNPGRYAITGSGLGLRRALLGPLRSLDDGVLESSVDFMEVAPENWINVGGRLGRRFEAFTERLPFVCHGLSLSLGGPSPLDETLLARIRKFLDRYQVRCYSEHLSYCTDDGHLYDLMPIPFTEEAVHYVAARIRHTQELLDRRIAIENVSYYAAPGAELTEIEFIRAVVEEADCDLLLDVNNIHVNSINHGYDPVEFLKAMPGERIAYGHIAGHYVEAEDLRVDTHGAEVIPDVWELLDIAYQTFGQFPTLLERDFNFPAIDELLGEVAQIRAAQARHAPDLKQPSRLGNA